VSEIREISLPSRLDSVDKAATIADEFAKSHSLDDEFVYAIDLAIRESVANAVKHGNKLDETKKVDVTLTNSAVAFEITVRDFGSGFDVDDIADATAPENLLKTDGRGILFMRSFMDEVEWTNADGGGLLVRMSKTKKG
jgi:serine/threonine-protein kinase RsbW